MQLSDDLIKPLHGLRGIAAFTVVLGHARHTTRLPDIDMAPSLGVVLFFVLSGYLMGWRYLSPDFTLPSAVRYAVARIARVFPLFAVAIISGAVVYAAGAAPRPFSFGPDRIARHLLFAGSGATVWTVSVEMRFYACFMLLWLVYAVLPTGRDAIMTVGIVVTICALWLFGIDGGRIALHRYLHIFLMGVLAAIILKHVRHDRLMKYGAILLPALLLAYAAAFLVVPMLYRSEQIYADLAVCLSATILVTAAVVAQNSVVGKFLSSDLLLFAGEISFGVYLFHRFALLGLDGMRIANLPGPIRLAAVLIATTLIAWLANIFIERPSRFVIRSWGDKLLALR
jgi:peptidoglycan/LPS O-acetylase OafA/YrhL